MTALKRLIYLLALLGLFSFSSHSSQILAAEPRRADRLKVGYASVSGNRISLWAAQEMGFFARAGRGSQA